MNTLRVVSALLVLAALAVLRPAPALADFTAPDGSFSISLPGDFVSIPALELYTAGRGGKAGPVTPEAMAQFKKTHFGFQKPADKWFTPPYVIITIETGRKRTPQDLFMDHVLSQKDSESAASPSDKSYRFLEKEHLPLKRMHYYKDVAHNQAMGKPVAMGVYTYLTTRGFLRVAWFCPADQLAEWEPVLHEAAMSLTLSPELEYKAKP